MSARASTWAAPRACSGAMYAGVPIAVPASVTFVEASGIADGGRGGGGGEFGGGASYPPEYRAGVGTEGVAALKDFVNKGGTLVALGGAIWFSNWYPALVQRRRLAAAAS